MRIARAALFCALLIAVGGLAGAADPDLPPNHAELIARGTPLFKQHVRSVLLKQCHRCHGGDSKEAEFDLTTREGLLAGSENGPMVVPFHPDRSKLLKLIRHEAEPNMPEDASKLPDETLAKIEEWIKLGAPYDAPLVESSQVAVPWMERKIPDDARQYWAFQPLAAVEPPAADGQGWARTPVDRFVLAKRTEHRLKANPPVDKRKLIRRVYFDLLGLPPKPDEVQAFLADERSDAYDRLLDRLLESPHFGERWARYWLDVARFAESHGFEQDYDRPYAYHYRDFVIKALNQDLPYDQFVRWQLAGDELAPDEPLAMMATGFLGAGVFPTQITANEVERTRYDALDDMAATTGTAMLGLTIGCARCHDHKFDPIPQGDYYRFTSTFTTTVRSEIDLDLTGSASKVEAEFQQAHAPIAAELARFERDELPARLAAWEASRNQATPLPAKWQVLEPASAKSAGGATLTPQGDGSLLASGTNPDFDTYTFVCRTQLTGITAIRLEALAHPSFVRGGPGRAGNGNIALTDFRLTARPLDPAQAQTDQPVEVKFSGAQATFEQAPALLVKYAIDGDKKSAWALDPQFGKDHAAVFETAGDVGFAGGAELTFTLEFKNNNQHNIGRPRLSLTTAARPVSLEGEALPQGVAAALALPAAQRSPAQTATVLQWYRTTDAEWLARKQAVDAHLAKKPAAPLTKVMVCSEGVKPIRHHTQGADFFNEYFYLKRGEINQKQGQAPQSFLQVLMPADGSIELWRTLPATPNPKLSYRRTALANWITDVDRGAGPLLARVAVNRLWAQHFGRGIVSTPNDFGRQGEKPTHPELLDWLARQLVAGGWKLKPLHKLLMTSAVYLQSADDDADNLKIDPENRWLWRYAPRRLEAEAIRDAMLAASGTLDRTMFGPGTLDEGHKRRSIYFMVKRSKLIPMMTLFDAPEPLVSVGSRPSTTIAPQALMFMNSPHVRGYAQALAGQLGADDQRSPADAVTKAYWTVLSRPPRAEDLQEDLAFLEAQAAAHAAAKRGNPRQLALADFCQVLFCLNEFVYVE